MAEVLADFDTAHSGPIHDAQVDSYGECLATASADGHVRLWDVRKPSAPGLLADLGAHRAAVLQVAWAPAGSGVLLATAGADSRVLVWGQRGGPGTWVVLHEEDLGERGAVHSVAWAPAEYGTAFACVCADGSATVVEHHRGAEPGSHSWPSDRFQAHSGAAVSVSWCSPPAVACGPLGLSGARLATAGDDGVSVWRRGPSPGFWTCELADAPSDLKVATRDVAWKVWGGDCEVLASVVGREVVIWRCEAECWKAAQRIPVDEEVWRAQWADLGNVLLLSCGTDDQHTVLLKQQLSGDWDVMDVTAGGG